jgi:hypothetical protein
MTFDGIHRYTRANALRDGVLIDVTPTALEAGIRYPVALTAAAWAECVAVPPGVECQDEAGRLWDVLTLLRCAIKGAKDGAREVCFAVHVRNDNRDGTPPLLRLKALYGPGNHRDAARRGLSGAGEKEASPRRHQLPGAFS